MADERAVDEQYLASLERRLAALKQGPKGTKAAKKQFLSDLASRKDFELFRLLTSEPGAGTSLDSERPDSDPFAEFDRPIDANYIQRKVAPQTVAVNQQEKLRLLISDLLDIQCQEADGEDAQVLQILAKESLELKAQSETKEGKEEKQPSAKLKNE